MRNQTIRFYLFPCKLLFIFTLITTVFISGCEVNEPAKEIFESTELLIH